ncbi:MAG: tetratricopeptide repeat protein [Pikeienuella sp.]
MKPISSCLSLANTRWLCFAPLLVMVACAGQLDDTSDAVEIGPSNVIDATNLNELMLTVSNPEDGVSYFQNALQQDPDRLDLKRGYALSLARARRHAEATRVFAELAETPAADDILRIEYAHSLARLERWDEAEEQMILVSPWRETARRYLIVAMLADQRNQWDQSDRAYEQARQLSTNPANVLNNWGVSQMSRGDYKQAQRTFEEAIAFNPSLFNAKNNLAVSRALQGDYRLPIVTVDEVERATLLHNIAVIALRRGDREQAKGLLTMAMEAHPRHYSAAAEKLAALEANVVN